MSSTQGSSPAISTLPPPAPPPRKSLPLGVAVLAVLVGLYGFVLFVLGLLLFAKHGVSQYLGVPSLGLAGYELAGLVTIIGLVILGIGVALWRLRLWALVLGLLFLLYELVAYAYAGKYETFGFVLALVIFLYLIAVNRHFR
jgi:hypothetical protein